MRLISAVLGTKSMKAREDASAALLNYGYTFYETVALKKKGDVLLSPRVYKGEVEMIPAVVARDVWATLPRGSAASLVTTTSLYETLIAPTTAAQTNGHGSNPSLIPILRLRRAITWQIPRVP